MSTKQISAVPSFIAGQWWTPESQGGTEVRDANTGELLASVTSDKLDVSAAVVYGRSTGHQELAKLTLHERALKLKELALYLNERRKDLYEISFKTGATKTDSMVDIDGGIGVLFTFSSKGRRELPNNNVILDGPTEPLSKDGSFIGTHIYTAMSGVVVQVNAFNFPVWGMLEKFAPAFIAGVPTIVKPATPTGYLAEAAVRLMLDSGILPEGSLQLLSGSARDLMDHLDYRDMFAFTGSAATANKLKSHPNVIDGECDSRLKPIP